MGSCASTSQSQRRRSSKALEGERQHRNCSLGAAILSEETASAGTESDGASKPKPHVKRKVSIVRDICVTLCNKTRFPCRLVIVAKEGPFEEPKQYELTVMPRCPQSIALHISSFMSICIVKGWRKCRILGPLSPGLVKKEMIIVAYDSGCASENVCIDDQVLECAFSGLGSTEFTIGSQTHDGKLSVACE